MDLAMDAARLKLPGFGLPLNFHPPNARLFPTALNIYDDDDKTAFLPLTTLREFTMLRLMNQMTDQSDWDKKVFDEKIISKWTLELLGTERSDLTIPMINWCIAEVQYKVKNFKETGAVSVYDGDVVKSDTAVSEMLKEELKAAVAPLENVPAWLKDWHPDSDEKVLDLVHPSLYPLIYGQTRILPDSLTNLDDCVERCGEGVVVSVPPEEERSARGNLNHPNQHPPYSGKFQWLPCEVDISHNDGNAKITSYINNLHPQIHKDLYTVVEKIITRAIPLWNMTLTALKAPYYRYPRIIYKACKYDPSKFAYEGPELDSDEEEDNNFAENREHWMRYAYPPVQPEPGEFEPPIVQHDRFHGDYYEEGTKTLKVEKTVDMRRDFGERGLQIIVKLANIHLTPTKPDYNGGSWHVEGQMNEHICSTALYYYDSVNITTSRLAFRQISNEEEVNNIEYNSNDYAWFAPIFGCDLHDSTMQEVGAVDTKEGRLVTFPNILQHQVQPFRLEDPTKPGHRKVLALFLVDPNIRIISTANVPCQQRKWWSQAIQEGHNAISHLPAELRDQIFEKVDGYPMDMDEAKALRLELMEERKKFVVSLDNVLQTYEFSLCQH